MKQILSEEFRRMQKLAGLITENEINEDENLNEWAIDMNAARTLITPENVDEYGEYDGEDTFEVENGSDRMADFWGDIYIAHEGDPEDWWDNEKVMGPLRYRFEQAINKAVKQKYGPDVTVEYY
jgi:hypothetical protein